MLKIYRLVSFSSFHNPISLSSSHSFSSSQKMYRQQITYRIQTHCVYPFYMCLFSFILPYSLFKNFYIILYKYVYIFLTVYTNFLFSHNALYIFKHTVPVYSFFFFSNLDLSFLGICTLFCSHEQNPKPATTAVVEPKLVAHLCSQPPGDVSLYCSPHERDTRQGRCIWLHFC